MSTVPTPERADIAALLDHLKATPGAPKEHIAAGFLWAAAEAFGKHTDGNELEFVDVAMRLLAGTLAKLDQYSATDYLRALADYLDANPETASKENSDHRMRANFLVLRSALALADAPAEGQA